MKKNIVRIDISKAVDNAFKGQEQAKLYNNNNVLRELLIKVNPQTMVDKAVKEYTLKMN